MCNAACSVASDSRNSTVFAGKWCLAICVGVHNTRCARVGTTRCSRARRRCVPLPHSPAGTTTCTSICCSGTSTSSRRPYPADGYVAGLASTKLRLSRDWNWRHQAERGRLPASRQRSVESGNDGGANATIRGRAAASVCHPRLGRKADLSGLRRQDASSRLAAHATGGRSHIHCHKANCIDITSRLYWSTALLWVPSRVPVRMPASRRWTFLPPLDIAARRHSIVIMGSIKHLENLQHPDNAFPPAANSTRPRAQLRCAPQHPCAHSPPGCEHTPQSGCGTIACM